MHNYNKYCIHKKINITYCDKELASFKSCLISSRNLTSKLLPDPFCMEKKNVKQ